MISQTDAALTGTTTTLTLNDNPAQQQQQTLSNDINLTDITSPQSRSNNSITQTNSSIHNGKSSKVGGGFANVKKRKKFDETIIDGFAIIAFRTWEDLQDELNERNSIINSNNNSIINSGVANIETNTTANKCTTDATSTNKKANSKFKSKSSSNLSTTNSDASSLSSASNLTTTQASVTHSNAGHKEVTSSCSSTNKKKDKSKKGAGHQHQVLDKANHQLTKDKRNKTSSEKNTLKRALEAKELAEKRLSILQEKLEQEQSKNRILKHETTSITATTNVPLEHYANSQTTPTHITKEEQQQHHHHSSRTNGMLGQVLHKDPNQAPKPMPYPPFHINSHLHQQDTAAIRHQMQIHNATLNPTSPPRINQQSNIHHQQATQPSQHQHLMKHPTHLIHQQHQSTPPPLPLHQQPPLSAQLPQQQQLPIPPHPSSHLLHQTPPPSQPSLHPSHPYYNKQSPQFSAPSQPQPHPHAHLLQQHHQPPAQTPLNPYSHQPQSSIMSSMGLSSLPSPYSCPPPSIYITDTISRQTSIIPPPSLGPAIEQSNPQAPGSRFGHSSVLHSISPYTPPVPPPHHPMYYPTLPTERSFIEFARSYTGPGHLGYSNLMNSFPTSSSNTTANPYSFDRWPRMALDQRAAVSRYNSLYQSTTILPDRTYANYTNTRAPTFPAGLFPPPF